MSIANYTELQSSVSSWLHRTDVSTVAPDLIKMGENILNRKLRLMQMENVATLTTSTTDRFATLPTGFIEAIDLALYSENYPQTLTQVPLVNINSRATDIQALPHYYAISTNIIFDVISDQVYTCAFRYLKKWDIASDTTNWLLTNHPDAYLYAALTMSTTYIKNPARIPEFKGYLEEIVQDLNKLDARTRGKSKLMVEGGLRQSIRSDIFTGDML